MVRLRVSMGLLISFTAASWSMSRRRCAPDDAGVSAILLSLTPSVSQTAPAADELRSADVIQRRGAVPPMTRRSSSPAPERSKHGIQSTAEVPSWLNGSSTRRVQYLDYCLLPGRLVQDQHAN